MKFDDWSRYFSRATEQLRKADECFLLKQYEQGTKHLMQARINLELVQACILS